MVLVFYGHFIEEFMLLKNSVGASQYKFIYSFHMVLFIVLSGYISKERKDEWGIKKFLTHSFFSRLLPYIFFTFFMMIPPFFFNGKFYGLILPSFEGYAKGLLLTAFGLSSFCVPSWFLLLIIGVEVVHYATFRFLKNSNTKLLIAVLSFYVVGYFLNLKLDIFNPLKGRIVGWNYFFIHEAITMYAFYLIGIYLRRKQFLKDTVSIKITLPAAIVLFSIVFFTYKLNNGPFNFNVYNYVVILFASHGHMLLFPLTAIAGCSLIIFLARMTPEYKIITWLGQNTLILMCLNGIFYHYINPGLAKWILENFSGSAITISVSGIIVTFVSLALCIPFIFLFNKYIPQLIGKPKINGPLIKNLVA